MSGTLYVVATPIGNLEDITLRALRILREVDVIAAEDTRRTARLLGHHGISTRTLSFHEHNTRSRLPQLVGKLLAGEDIAIVTDAGTPCVSDPGLELVQAAIERGISVDPIPGPAAPLAALVASGFALTPFTVYGFPPRGAKARNQWLGDLALVTHTFSFFEAPHRIRETLSAAAISFGDRPIMMARELTKVHQEFVRGTAGQLWDGLTEPRGEFTLVVGPADNSISDSDILLTDAEIVHFFWQSTEKGGASRRQIVTTLARQSGRTPKEVYAVIERAKKSGIQP
jgi:16S rRNA (cytidine1402-2'-O)-methyltransferase